MGHAYTILGKTIQPHILAIATLATVGGAGVFFTSGDSKKVDSKATSVETPASSEEINVEELLNDFLKEDTTQTK